MKTRKKERNKETKNERKQELQKTEEIHDKWKK